MAKRHFLQQSHKWNSSKHKLAGKLLSEKLDGQRAYWDGGITRGMLKSEVPWANCAKDSRYRVPPVATGLWSRYGNVIHAPAWFLDLLPAFPVDGELWTRRGGHQECRSIISKLIPNNKDWKKVHYVIFDSPAYESIFYDSVIDLPNYHKELIDCLPWIADQCLIKGVSNFSEEGESYETTLVNLDSSDCWNDHLHLLNQTQLSDIESEAREQYEKALSDVLALNGEGLVTRSANFPYLPERVHHCTKHKPYQDAEGTVVGYVTGRETDKGSKLLGMMGAMIVEWNGKTFQLSGFTDAERQLILDWDELNNLGKDEAAYEWACDNPETECPNDMFALHFPRGSQVTFKYRELTDDGVPKEASYMRKFNV
jgi:hypothetical protein